MYVYTYTYVYIYIYICMNIYIYIYIYCVYHNGGCELDAHTPPRLHRPRAWEGRDPQERVLNYCFK